MPETVKVCRTCSMLNPLTAPHGLRECSSRDWVDVPLVDHMGVESKLVMPHPDGGWPEIHITTIYMVHSDDRVLVQARLKALVEEADPLDG